MRPDGTSYPITDCPLDRALPLRETVRGHEDVFVHKDGRFYPVRCNARPVFRGGVPVATVIEAWDITREKQSEERIYQLLESEKQHSGRLAEVAAASLEAHSVRSLDGVLNVVTEEARRIIGTHQAVTGLTKNQQWAQAIHTISLSDKYDEWRGYDVKPEGSGIYAAVCRANKPMRMTQAELEAHPEYRRFGAENANHPPLRGWMAAPLSGSDGRNLGVIQLSDKVDGSDFTAEDEAILVQLATIASVAIENARLYDALWEADRRKDEFLAMLAHELRNPLAPIRTGLDLLAVEESDGHRETIELMQEQVEHVVRLVDDLLDVSRIMRGKIDLRREPVELGVIVKRSVEAVRASLEHHAQQLVVSAAAEPIWLNVDPVLLVQVIENLLSNASKYTDRGGRVELSVERRGGEASIRVRDTGIGIDPELLPKIFDLFTQSVRSLDRSKGGLGVGLSLVKRLVEMHGGTVSAHSEGPDRGSEFVCRLPVIEAAAQTRPAAELPTSLQARRIVVVDDNAGATQMLSALLRKLGAHEVEAAHDGPSALAKIEQVHPEIVLLDIGLPGMDGYEVAATLRKMPQFDPVLLVALTGYGQESDRQRSKEAGFDEHLVKPTSVDQMKAVLAHPKLAVSE